jgi:hypothetical protein
LRSIVDNPPPILSRLLPETVSSIEEVVVLLDVYREFVDQSTREEAVSRTLGRKSFDDGLDLSLRLSFTASSPIQQSFIRPGLLSDRLSDAETMVKLFLPHGKDDSNRNQSEWSTSHKTRDSIPESLHRSQSNSAKSQKQIFAGDRRISPWKLLSDRPVSNFEDQFPSNHLESPTRLNNFKTDLSRVHGHSESIKSVDITGQSKAQRGMPISPPRGLIGSPPLALRKDYEE